MDYWKIDSPLNYSFGAVEPFNGPDVPDFAGDPAPALVRAWYKLGFLFFSFRNHSIKSGGPKEPWRFGKRTEKVVAGMIRSRYREGGRSEHVVRARIEGGILEVELEAISQGAVPLAGSRIATHAE